MEERASAAENACSGGAAELFSVEDDDDDEEEEEQWIKNGFGFGADGEVSLGFKSGFERFVGIVRDIFANLCLFWGWFFFFWF